MQGKIKSSIPIMFIVLSLFFGLHFLTTNAVGDILSGRQEIESLIEAGRLTDAQTQMEKLKADYSQDSGLPEALYWIAERYRWEHKWKQAINLYNQIIQNHPDSLSASRANLGIARVGVLSRLVDRDYDGAQQALDELVADFTGHPDLPESLCNIAEGFRWGHKWEKARSLYKQIKQDYPNTSYASRAKLAIANLEVVSSLVAKNYTAAQKSLEEMINNFPDHPDMPETLYHIAEGYRWAHKWQEAKNTYQQIIEKHPDSSYADRARLGQSKVEVLSLIVSRNFGPAEEALNKLIADFSGHPDLPDTLFRIAEGFRWWDKYEIAKNLYGRIIQEYPESSAANQARQQFHVVVEGLDVFALIESGRDKKAQDAINRLMAKSASDETGEISPYTLFLCGDKYYARGYQKKQDGFLAEAERDFLKAIGTWQNMIQQLPASTSVGHAYYHSANCYCGMGDYEHAIEQYVKLLENYPNYYLAWDVHFKIGHYYQKLKDSGAVESSTADAHTKAFYKQVLEKYPDCHAAKAAQNWLKKHAK